MTNYQESYEKMSWSRVSYLNSNAAITTTLPNFNTYFTAIETVLTQIRAAGVQQEADKTGDTTVKKQLRATLVTQAIDVSRRVVAYATNTDNSSLLALVDYTETNLKKASDEKLVSISQLIHDNANANVTNLSAYGVTPEALTAVQTSINNFKNTIPKGRVNTTDSSQVTKLLASLFATLKTNWAKIDTLVNMVQTSHPEFYKGYQDVSKVIETGTGSLPLKIKAVNAITGTPEANVTLTLIPVNGQVKTASMNGKGRIVKKTAAGGGSNYKSLEDGPYTVEAEKPGFKKVINNINIVNGEITVLEIKMEKL